MRTWSAPDGTLWVETYRLNEHVELRRHAGDRTMDVSQEELDHIGWDEI